MRRWPFAVIALASSRTAADPLQLRADALATTAAPAGLVTLEATGDAGPGLSAEAVVWTGSASDQGRTDVLVMVLRARTADGRAAGRLGRFVETLGALRPIQIDGAAARLRAPLGLDLDAYAGVPVTDGLATPRTWDWAAGGRIARRIGDGSIGLAYAEQRDDGRLVSEELGIDAGSALGAHDDAAAKLAYDLANPGIAEISVTASHRTRAVRTELYLSDRAASHLLPATSLFTVLGDVPAQHGGAVVTWRAAPLLDVIADLGARRVDRELDPAIALRARLRLDDLGTSSLTGELRRDGAGPDTWTGAHAAARIALPCSLAATTELELVIADRDRGHGTVWPWGLVALAWDLSAWQAAIALEGSASPEDRRRLDVLAQLGRRWGMR
jgi:hypothetical protein